MEKSTYLTLTALTAVLLLGLYKSGQNTPVDLDSVKQVLTVPSRQRSVVLPKSHVAKLLHGLQSILALDIVAVHDYSVVGDLQGKLVHTVVISTHDRQTTQTLLQRAVFTTRSTSDSIELISTDIVSPVDGTKEKGSSKSFAAAELLLDEYDAPDEEYAFIRDKFAYVPKHDEYKGDEKQKRRAIDFFLSNESIPENTKYTGQTGFIAHITPPPQFDALEGLQPIPQDAFVDSISAQKSALAIQYG